MIISLDCESTGLDWVRNARPFLVTTCDSEGVIRFWEWDVNPYTRMPDIPDDDLWSIRDLMEDAELIYLQNSKFDAHALKTVGLELPWYKVRDTLIMGHLLGSNHKHDLTSMCYQYLQVDIEPYEKKIEEVVKACRSIVRREYPDWKIAREDDPEMPSISGSSKRDEDKPWKNDMWLPRAYIRSKRLESKKPNNLNWKQSDIEFGHGWSDACSRYANTDSSHTLYLGLEMERIIAERGLWNIYEHRLHLMRVAYEMESYGVTTIGTYTENTIEEYECYTAEAAAELKRIASEFGHELEMAEGASLNDNMRDFFYGAEHLHCPMCHYNKRIKHWNDEVIKGNEHCPKCAKGTRRRSGVIQKLRKTWKPNLNLNVITSKKTGNASLDKEAMGEYLRTLDTGPALDFIRLLVDKRKHDTSLSYMESYRRYWVPVLDATGYYRIHPFLNPCATDHLRWASNNPNLQNVGKQEVRCEECNGSGCELCGGTGLTMLSARNCFGPAPGREWWSMDFSNIEKRIPAYECGEPALIELFEKPNDPPYWGSDHNLLASILFPDLYWPLAEIHPDAKGSFKKRYINEYKKTKNTNFAKQYGAGKNKVDSTAGVPGAFEMISRGMPKLAELQTKYLRFAERHGYVETLPDRTVDPKRGYPILASRTEDGRVLSTTPFNYHVSGTACWCKNTAAVRCSDQLAEWRKEGFDAYMSLEIHDELLFDFPRGVSKETNLAKALRLKQLMEESGSNLIPSIPIPVTVGYHSDSWAKEDTV